MENWLSNWLPTFSPSQTIGKWYHGSVFPTPLPFAPLLLLIQALHPCPPTAVPSNLISFQSLCFHPISLFLQPRNYFSPSKKKKNKSDLLQPCLKPFNSSALWGRIKSKQLALWALSTLNLIFLEVTLSSSILSNFSAHKTPWELWAIHTSMLLLMFFSLLNTDSSFKIRFKETHERC